MKQETGKLIACITLIIGSLILFKNSITSSVKNEPSTGRRLVRERIYEEIQKNNRSNCSGIDINRQIRPKKVRSTFQSSYPGSGDKLTTEMIKTITGIQTADENDPDFLRRTVVTIKTHYPAYTKPEVFFTPKLQDVEQAILLLQHPLDAIESFHNLIFESGANQALLDHTNPAPMDKWLQWRDANFDLQLQKWIDHTIWWVKQYGETEKGNQNQSNRLHVLSYEDLISADSGAEEMMSMIDFLTNVHPAIKESINYDISHLMCLWEKLVSRDEYNQRRFVSYPYTSEQYNKAIYRLSKLRDSYNNFTTKEPKSLLQQARIKHLLNGYIKAIKTRRKQGTSTYQNMIYLTAETLATTSTSFLAFALSLTVIVAYCVVRRTHNRRTEESRVEYEDTLPLAYRLLEDKSNHNNKDFTANNIILPPLTKPQTFMMPRSA